MVNDDPELNINYDAHLNATEEMLYHALKLCRGEPPDEFEQGYRTGVIVHWYQLALLSNAPVRQCNADQARLYRLAEMPGEDGLVELPARNA
ncbi:hypothetical protein TB147_17480 [Klebsiella aerogenes]|uniref:hypothetical protein n=1 Tax=Klebsiella aerogenes TaxID=548 RepID=UPI002E37FE14|nr:hypothetical protein [Klebsiella aerogenes]MED7793100.1 hypothetical protein [Klebsiella aerogenes]